MGPRGRGGWEGLEYRRAGERRLGERLDGREGDRLGERRDGRGGDRLGERRGGERRGGEDRLGDLRDGRGGERLGERRGGERLGERRGGERLGERRGGERLGERRDGDRVGERLPRRGDGDLLRPLPGFSIFSRISGETTSHFCGSSVDDDDVDESATDSDSTLRCSLLLSVKTIMSPPRNL